MTEEQMVNSVPKPRGIPNVPLEGYTGAQVGLPNVGGMFHPADNQGGYFWDVPQNPNPEYQTMGEYYARAGDSSGNRSWYDAMMQLLAAQSMDDVKSRMADYLNLKQLWNRYSGLQGSQKTVKGDYAPLVD